MSWINSLMEGSTAPVERTVCWDGKEALGYFRRISAAERMQLVQGQRVATKNGQAEIEVDLGANEGTKHKMVFFSACNQDGTRAFASVKEVAALPGSLVHALYKHSADVNKDETEEEVGKD
jgi:hypothetical protein